MSSTVRHDHRTLTEWTHERLIEMIRAGALPPGGKLDEQGLSESLGISRTPLREAVARLVADSLVERVPYRGNFVRSFTAREVSDLYEVRKVLEGLAATLAVERMSQDDLEEVAHILADAASALERSDLEAYGIADQRFHELIAQRSQNQPLIDALDRLQGQIQIVRAVANQDTALVERTARERPSILAALRARDGEKASRLLQAHIEGVRIAVLSQL
jgi:DNA-binding GntR family transcriptional regulator